MCDVETVRKIATCLAVRPGKVALNEEKVVTRTGEDSEGPVTGFANILTAMARESQAEAAKNSFASRAVEAQVYQWIEFAILYVSPGVKDKHIAQQLLRDFNRLFLTRSYLVGQSLTLADLAVFYAIHELMKSLSPLERENQMNLSRWFDHLQQQPAVCQRGDLLNFATIYLHSWATGTHV